MGKIDAKTNQDEPLISPEDYVKVTKMNHIIEVQHMEKMNKKQNIKKLDKDTYLEISTGEIKQFAHSENRQENYNSLRQTFKKLRYLINNNFIGAANELHITMTYKENMTDPDRLYKDFNKFIKRLKYKYKDTTNIDYINVIEPQQRGAWHCHFLIKFNQLDKIFIKNKDLRELWGQGFVTIKPLKGVDNIGAYLSAYLSDVEVKNEFDALGKNVETKIVEGKEKKFIKGGRLHMYPPGMNIYRKSKGIEYPEQQTTKYKNIKKIAGSAKPHYHKAYKIESEEYQNTITYIQYNTKRTL